MATRLKSRKTWYSIVLIVCSGILLSGCGGGESSSPQEVSATPAPKMATSEAEAPTATPKPTVTPVPTPTKTAKEHLTSGNDYFEQDDLEQAIAEYTQAIELDPNYALAYYNLGVAHNDLGELEEAIADYSQVIEIDPTYAEAYNNRGHVYYQLGDYETAITDYNQALKLDPNRGEWYFNRALAYGAAGVWEQAIADYNQAVAIDPQVPQIYYQRGIAYSNVGQVERAIADFERALAMTNDRNLQELAKNRLKELEAGPGVDAPPTDFTTYTSDALGLSFQYPSGWAVMEEADSFAAFIGIAPDESLFGEDTPFEQDVGVMVIAFLDLGEFNTTDLVEIQADFLDNSFGTDVKPIGKIKPVSIPGPAGVTIEGIARKYKGMDTVQGEIPVILDITTIIQGGRVGFFIAVMTEKAEAEYWPALQTILASLEMRVTPPEQVANIIFEAAQTQNFALLKDLCDPLGENDDDTQQICNLATDETNRAEFVQVFQAGRLNGLARFSPEGDKAEVPFLFGPNGDRDETMILVKRDGQWYLYGF